jgi:type IV secretory pathway VirB10-like protein
MLEMQQLEQSIATERTAAEALQAAADAVIAADGAQTAAPKRMKKPSSSAAAEVAAAQQQSSVTSLAGRALEDDTAAAAAAAVAEGTRLEAVAKATVRIGLDIASRRVGFLLIGDVIEVLEVQQGRVRFAHGWASLVTPSGITNLVPTEAEPTVLPPNLDEA